MIQLRNHTFYFRLSVPKRLRPLTSKNQIYSSLRTKDRSVAELKVAQLLPLIQELRNMATSEKLDRAALAKLLNHFDQQLKPQDELSISELEGEIAYLDDCMQELALKLANPATNQTAYEKYNRDGHGSELSKGLLMQIGHPEPNSRTRFEADKALHTFCDKRHKQTLSALYGNATQDQTSTYISQQNSSNAPTSNTPRISELIGGFLKQQKERISASTIESYKSKLYDLVELTGDIRVNELDAHMADHVRDTLRKLPANRKKANKFKGLSIVDLIELKPKPMSEQTVYGFISCYKVFFNWIKRYHPQIKNNPFEGMPALKPASVVKESELREPWTKSDLRALFASQVFTGEPPKIKYQYWLPLLGLFTGARLNELCQLMATDILEVEDIWCINITDTGDRQRLKNANSRRYIPIHSKLIELGFVKYAKSRGKQRLFSDLNYTEKAGFGAYPSKWFARYRNNLSLTASFHGLRKTFSNELKQLGIPEDKAAELTGHKSQGITYGRYAGGFSVQILKNVIEELDFNDVLGSF